MSNINARQSSKNKLKSIFYKNVLAKTVYHRKFAFLSVPNGFANKYVDIMLCTYVFKKNGL